MRNVYSLLFFLFFITNVSAQSYPDEITLYPGLYLTFEDFANNSPVPPEMILYTPDNTNTNFYPELFNEREVTVKIGLKTMTIPPSDIWGYSDGRLIYINRDILPGKVLKARRKSYNRFAELILLETYSVVYCQRIIKGGIYANTFPGSNIVLENGIMINTPPQTIVGIQKGRIDHVLCILNTKDGTIYKPTLKNIAHLLGDDPELLEAFKTNEEYKKRKDKD